MTVYEIIVYLHEGEDIRLGIYRRREDAERELRLACEEWEGPNVFQVEMTEIEVQ